MEQTSQPDYQPRVITCVYCGQAYPQDTPTWGDKVLTDHIKVCEKHPMRKAEADIRKLRKALSLTLGDSTKSELEFRKSSFELRLNRYPVEEWNSNEDLIILQNHIKAIDAMLETMEYE